MRSVRALEDGDARDEDGYIITDEMDEEEDRGAKRRRIRRRLQNLGPGLRRLRPEQEPTKAKGRIHWKD
jgi:hypothetical protein